MAGTCWLAEIDWSAVGSVLQGVGTLTGAFAVIWAANKGASTFDNWRRQKLSERRIEQAERVLTTTYRVRRGLSIVRNSRISPHEIAAAEKSLKDNGEWPASDSEQSRFKRAQVYYNRLDSMIDVRLALEECQPMARALFGEELEKAIETLNRQFWIVEVSVHEMRLGGADHERQRDIQATICEGYPPKEKNEVDKTIAEQVKAVEDICVPVLRLDGEKRKPE